MSEQVCDVIFIILENASMSDSLFKVGASVEKLARAQHVILRSQTRDSWLDDLDLAEPDVYCSASLG